ncbi:MAG: sugar phosphate nucleotidyltransferase, partial [Pseudomonadota bacterium]
VRQNIDIIDSYEVDYIVVLAGDHIYKMDYEKMIAQHVAQSADVTIGCLTVPRAEASAFGVMAVDASLQITDFLEKPADPPAIPGDPAHALASMGIYVFDWRFLRDLLLSDAEDSNSSHDFGHDLIPHIVKNGKAMAHRFADSCVMSGTEPEPYWRDVGTIDAFHAANIDLTDFEPKLDLYDRTWPIWTYAEIVPPAKFIHDEKGRRGSAVSSMVSGGCIVSGAKIRNSLLFTAVHAHSYSVCSEVVALPYADIGENAELSKCVLDRGVQIPAGLVVGQDPEEDGKWFRRTDKGVVLITQEMLDARAAALA